MNTELINHITAKHRRTDLANFKVGDTIDVGLYIREGDKRRVQRFKGIVIAIDGKGVNKTFTIRKISYGVGVEKIIPLNSPNISDIEVLKHGKLRRSKAYYLRQRVGKLAMKVKAGKPAPVIEYAEEAQENFADDVAEVIVDDEAEIAAQADTEANAETAAEPIAETSEPEAAEADEPAADTAE